MLFGMGEDFTKRVAAEVRAELARQKVSQEALCARIGMSQSTLSRRITGEYPFDTTELAKIAEALGVSVAQFLPNGVAA